MKSYDMKCYLTNLPLWYGEIVTVEFVVSSPVSKSNKSRRTKRIYKRKNGILIRIVKYRFHTDQSRFFLLLCRWGRRRRLLLCRCYAWCQLLCCCGICCRMLCCCGFWCHWCPYWLCGRCGPSGARTVDLWWRGAAGLWCYRRWVCRCFAIGYQRSLLNVNDYQYQYNLQFCPSFQCILCLACRLLYLFRRGTVTFLYSLSL